MLIGTVKKTNNLLAYVEVTKHASCKGCPNCIFKDSKRLVIPTINSVGARERDRVELQPAKEPIKSAPLVMFGIPLLLIAITIIALSSIDTLLCVVAALFAGAVGVFVAYLIDKAIIKNLAFSQSDKLAKIINIVDDESISEQQIIGEKI